MNVVHEWSLLVFTILAQMAVGSFLVLCVVRALAGKFATQELDRLTDWPFLALGAIMVVALVASLFHLGNPLNAPRAVTNLGSSWVSREILCAVLFTAVAGIFELAQWRKIASPGLRNVVAWIAVVIGLALVFVMGKAYMLPTVPVWDTVLTPVSFFTTALLLGVVAMGAALVANLAYNQKKAASDSQALLVRSALRWLALAAMILLGVEFVVAPFYVANLVAHPPSMLGGITLAGSYGILFAVRLFLVFAGAGVLGMFVYQFALLPSRQKVLGNLAYAVFGLVLVSEVVGRLIFYASRLRIGM